MRAIVKLSIFLGVLVADALFFVYVQQLPDSYSWLTSSISNSLNVSVDATTSVILILGVLVAVACIVFILYFLHSFLRERSKEAEAIT